jgi:pyruvate dehydrogenase E2 component (dihydrolipoamide acetyltransferase)
MGYDMQEGTVVRWLKSEGAQVELGEAIAEIETDKAVVEFESYAAGVLHHILVTEGTTVPVGQVIAIVGAEDETPVRPPPPQPAPTAEVAPEAAPAAIPLEAPADQTPADDADAPLPEDEDHLFATPAARKIAQEQSIDLAGVPGTGPGGRIVKQDVLDHWERDAVAAEEAPLPVATPLPPAEAAPPPEAPAPAAPAPPAAAPEELAPLSRMRRQIARVTVRSKSEKPHFYVATDVDMTRAMALRRDINQALAEDGVRVTVNDLIIRACIEALKKYPKFNAYYQDEGIRMNQAINVGLAIATDEGLIVPAILDCGDKSLKALAETSKDLADRASQGTLNPQEYSGGTFAISNLGMFGVDSFVAIIQPPQTAVLAVGAVRPQPVVRDDQVVIAQVMTATLSADHRIVDGAEGAQFINEVKRLLESPLSMLL